MSVFCLKLNVWCKRDMLYLFNSIECGNSKEEKLQRLIPKCSRGEINATRYVSLLCRSDNNTSMILRKVVLHSELTAPVFAPEFMAGPKGMKNIDHYLVGNGGKFDKIVGEIVVLVVLYLM